MPAKVAKHQKRGGKNNKRHSNKNSHHPNHKKKTHTDKLRRPKIVNGHQKSENDEAPNNDNSNNNNNNLDILTNEPLKRETNKKDPKATIDFLQRRRLHALYLGEEFMSKHNFEMARVYFEQSLNRHIKRQSPRAREQKPTATATEKEKEKKAEEDVVLFLPELPNELDIYCKLLICRMHCDNSNTNLSNALNEVNYILNKMPNSVQHHIISAELHIRTNNFEKVGSSLLKAAECDQANILDSVHLYFHQIAQNTINNPNDSYLAMKDDDDDKDKDTDTDTDKLTLSNVNIEKLCKFFQDMTLISQQNILSIEWDEIIEAINNCDPIICPLFSDSLNQNNEDIGKLKTFLIKTLEWNLPQNDKEQSLIFLKVEFAYILAKELWDLFPLSSINIDDLKEDVASMEDAIAIDCSSTYFLENGLFGCRDGYDFISAAIFEPSICLSSMFDIILTNKRFIINHSWLYESGIKLIDWLYRTPLYHIQDIKNTKSQGATCSDCEWDKFMKTRINAHYAIDPELNETVLSRDAHEDGKKFEDAMQNIVGKEKKNYLMQLELDLSIPILKKYANIMSRISGIDEDILIYELTLPDENDTDNDNDNGTDNDAAALTSSLLSEYLNNPKFQDYKPVGLPVLVQNAEFNINNVEYDKSVILSALCDLEKEVVQFQIDYKNKVYSIAGDAAMELDKVMSTLQYRGLELTKWLRNFVKYMIARRDIEQEIVNVSNKKTHKEAMHWFESMTNYLNGANNILLKIISKLFLDNLLKSYNKYNDNEQKEEEEEKEKEKEKEKNYMKYEKYEIYPGKKIEKISSRYFELDCMAKFYHSVKKQFENVMIDEKFENISEIKTFVHSDLLVCDEINLRKNILLSSLNMSCIKIPILEIAIPATLIENQYGNAYKNWIRYPLTQTYVDKTKLFIERCKYLRDNILCIIYSSVEKRCLLYPTLHASPNKYFKCIGCQKIYAQLLCKNCNLAHYCSIQCQHQHWDKFHKRECKKYANLSSPTTNIILK